MSFRHFAWACLAAATVAVAPAAGAATITNSNPGCTFPGVPDEPASGYGTVNVAVCTNTMTIDAITEVMIFGPDGGLYTFSDPATAPAPGETSDALAAAALALGLPAGTTFTGLTLSGRVTSQNFTETIDVLPSSPSAEWIGDPDDPLTWVSISGTFQVNVQMTTTVLNAYRLEARIDNGVSTIPLPASALLLITGLAGLGASRLRRNQATPRLPHART